MREMDFRQDIINHLPHIKVTPLDTSWTPRVHVDHLPPNPPKDLVAYFPRLNKILSTVHQPMNTLYWETWPPFMEVMNWGWTRFDLWTSSAQEKFDEIWPVDGDDWIDTLIDIYGSNWHNALPILVIRDQPTFIENLKVLCETRKITISGTYENNPDVVVNSALKYAPWVRTVKRRSWVYPCPRNCSICGEGYYVDTVRYYLVRKWGNSNVCPRCMFIASFGIPTISPLYRNFTRAEALKYLQDLSSLIQFIPPQSFRETIHNPGFDPDVLHRILAVMICIPNADMIKKKFGNISWLEVLQKSGLVGEAWRPARGTYCVAADGHLCRSLAERSVDDWFTRKGVGHQSEPYWPQDDELNPSGKLRADWELNDGTFVEYAGLNSQDYLSKIGVKRKLAVRAGINLIVLFPEDLQRLEKVFRAWIGD